MSPEDKVAREQALKQAVDAFSDSVVQAHWDDAFKLTDGSFDSAGQVKVPFDGFLGPGFHPDRREITSMAWVTDTIAKVKLTWTFQREASKAIRAKLSFGFGREMVGNTRDGRSGKVQLL